MFGPVKIAKDFPIFHKKINNHKLVYLDSAATAQKPRQVVEAMSEYYYQHNANVHRGVHTLGDESTRMFHQSRQEITAFFGAKIEQLVVTNNATQALNQIAYQAQLGSQAQLGHRARLDKGDVIIATEMEHHSNLVPWQVLAQKTQAQLKFVLVNSEGELDLDSLEQLLNEFGSRVKIVTLAYVSNVLGTLNPIEKIIALVRRRAKDTWIVLDAAQAAPHLPIRFNQLEADFLVVSAHKMLGPMGIGAMMVKEKILTKLEPWLVGGGMIDKVSLTESTYIGDLEEKFSPGTPNVAGLVGWAAACRYLNNLGMEKVFEHDQLLVSDALAKLSKVSQIKLIGPKTKRVGSVAFTYQDRHAHDVSQVLDSFGIEVRSGHHCAMPLHTKFGLSATIRASFQVYNTTQDIDRLVVGLKEVEKVLSVSV